MQYQVLARKWRPQNFEEIVGQEHVSRTLLNALQSGRIAHAFLFSGPRGSGKTSTARILARALNCHKGQAGRPCGSCPACTEVAAGNCMDVLEIDAASNTGVDNVRQLIEQARYQPARDKYKIFIIDEVHMLSNAAFSALLKTLEEPPSHVAFIMATTEYHKIPATILSRCQQYSFKLIPYPMILQRLRMISESENIEISQMALEQVVFSSGGSMRDAMSALDQVIAFSGDKVEDGDVMTLLGLIEPRILSRVVHAIAEDEVTVILNQVSELVDAGQDLQGFCRKLIGQFRNLMVVKAGVTDPSLLGVPESLLADLKEQAALFSKEDLIRLFEALLRIDNTMKYASQIRFQLEMGLIELTQVTKMQSLETLIAKFASMPEGGDPEPPAGKANPGPSSAPAPNRELPNRGRSERTRNISRPLPSDNSKKTESPRKEPRKEKGERSTSGSSKELLGKIASAVESEALESLLLRLDGARIEGDTVLFEMGGSNEFFRSKIQDSLATIMEAASEVVGRKVAVRMNEVKIPDAKGLASLENAKTRQPSSPDLLEKAKREPVVRSFLEVFPGQVKAEKIVS
ncbi:MAG: DNA polymerase III subunit gamma/tau [Acidobacteriota bacterium]